MTYAIYDLIPAADPVLVGLFIVIGCCLIVWTADTFYSWFIDKKR